MVKQCDYCQNNYSAKRKKQKYCSKKCRYNSKRGILIVKRYEIKCLNCSNVFFITENEKVKGNVKYCSRKCKDKHQKTTYLGVNNPSYGRVITEKERNERSVITKKIWEDPNKRLNIMNGMNNFKNKNGYWPGSDKKSIEKRELTMFTKYGVSHNWVGDYGSRKCDITVIKKYGKTTVDFLSDYNFKFGQKTDIEILFCEILDELKIEYQPKYRIYNKKRFKNNFLYKEFDFRLLNTNMLIEVDGDYWHGNEKIFKKLNEIQIKSKENDELKNNIATIMGFKIIRIWGSDLIKRKDVVVRYIKRIYEREIHTNIGR